MKTFSVYSIIAAMALGQVNAAALPSDEFHVVKDTELGPVYSNVSPKDRRDDATWYPVGGDASNPVYSNIDPGQIDKRGRPHGGWSQSGPGRPGRTHGIPWAGGNHKPNTNHDNNNDGSDNTDTTTDSDTTMSDADTESDKRDSLPELLPDSVDSVIVPRGRPHGGWPQSRPGRPGRHGNGRPWAGGNHNQDTNPNKDNDDGNENTDTTTDPDTTTSDPDTESDKRDEVYKPIPESEVEIWIKEQ